MTKTVNIHAFLELSKTIPILDVRSESEFEMGHMQNAVNIPILSNEQRKIVGTLYKQNGREVAVYKGLELLGPLMSVRLKKGVKLATNGKVLVHCWRGGMRSQFYAFLLHFYGLESILLEGGYKAFRGLVHQTFDQKLNIIVLGGKTGSGKTVVLKKLAELGEQVIDLEAIANHRGSSFGALGLNEQPSQEQFENALFTAISKLDATKTIWLEDENRTVGSRVIPEGFWNQMKASSKIFLIRDFEERLDQIMLDYSCFPVNDLIISMQRIGKRLGPQHVKRAIELLENGEIREAFEIALAYYDKAYLFGLEKNKAAEIIMLEGIGLTHTEIAGLLSTKKYEKK